MKYIDLLPKKEREINKRSIALNFVIVVLIIILVLMGASVYLLQRTNNNLYANLQKHEEAGRQLEDYVSKLEIYRQFEQKVASKGNMAQAVSQRTLLWSEVFYGLGQAIPENAYLTGFEGGLAQLQTYMETYAPDTDQPKVQAFEIRGYARNYIDVSRLMIHVARIPYIQDVWVRNISATQITESIAGTFFFIETYWDTQEIAKDWEIEEADPETVQIEELEEILDP